METIFRGKRIDNGQWVYGDYFKTPLSDENSGTTPEAGWFFLTGETRHCIGQNGVAFVVDPKSVSKYIGINNRNDKRIFEGDIIKKDHGHWGVIVWKAPFFEVTVSKDQSSLYTCEWIIDSDVIGNIFDNPELLNEDGSSK